MVRAIGMAMALAALALPAASGAQEATERERAAARELGRQGLELYDRGDFPAALESLERAHRLVRLPTTGLWSGRCYAKLGRLVEASERLYEVARLELDKDAPEVQRQAREDALREREALLARIPKVTLRVEGAAGSVRATLDGRALPDALLGVAQPMDPGEHHFAAETEGARAETRFAAGESAEREIVLRLEPAAAAAPSPATAATAPATAATEPALVASPVRRSPAPETPAPEIGDGSTMRVLGWVALGLGAAGVTAGAVAGGLAIDKRGELEDGCPAEQCPPPLHGDVDAYDTLRVVSSAGLIAGGVLAASGIVLLLVAPTSARLAPSAVGGIGLQARF